MKLSTYNYLNLNKWFSNSTIKFLLSSLKIGEKSKFILFSPSMISFLLSLKKKNLLFYFFINIPV